MTDESYLHENYTIVYNVMKHSPTIDYYGTSAYFQQLNRYEYSEIWFQNPHEQTLYENYLRFQDPYQLELYTTPHLMSNHITSLRREEVFSVTFPVNSGCTEPFFTGNNIHIPSSIKIYPKKSTFNSKILLLGNDNLSNEIYVHMTTVDIWGPTHLKYLVSNYTNSPIVIRSGEPLFLMVPYKRIETVVNYLSALCEVETELVSPVYFIENEVRAYSSINLEPFEIKTLMTNYKIRVAPSLEDLATKIKTIHNCPLSDSNYKRSYPIETVTYLLTPIDNQIYKLRPQIINSNAGMIAITVQNVTEQKIIIKVNDRLGQLEKVVVDLYPDECKPFFDLYQKNTNIQYTKSVIRTIRNRPSKNYFEQLKTQETIILEITKALNEKKIKIQDMTGSEYISYSDYIEGELSFFDERNQSLTPSELLEYILRGRYSIYRILSDSAEIEQRLKTIQFYTNTQDTVLINADTICQDSTVNVFDYDLLARIEDIGLQYKIRKVTY